MLNLILTVAMIPAASHAVKTSQIQTCDWPHRCAAPVVVVAQVQTCQWPHVCKQTPAA